MIMSALVVVFFIFFGLCGANVQIIEHYLSSPFTFNSTQASSLIELNSSLADLHGKLLDDSSRGAHGLFDALTALSVSSIHSSHEVQSATQPHPASVHVTTGFSGIASSSEPKRFSCQHLGQTYSPFSMCSGVVDYAFVVAEGSSLASMEAEVRGQAAALNAFLAVQCLSDAKKLICASVYLPCKYPEAANSSAVYTYTPSASSLSLPYLAPCRSLCESASYVGSTCRGLLEGLGFPINCDSLDPTSLMPTYSTDLSQCNALSSVQGVRVVAGSKELYIGSTCQTVFSPEAEVYLPDPSLTSALLAPLLPPFVLQTILEAGLNSLESALPMFFGGACLSSQRKLMCGLVFMTAAPVDDLSFLFGTVYLPSFPAHSLCQDYNNQCGDTLLTMIPVLRMNCSAMAGPLRLYPSEPQVILSLNLGYGPINLITPPNELASSTIALQTQCPIGYAQPNDDYTHNRIIIPGTDCAVGCPMRMYPDDTAEVFANTRLYTNWVSLLMGVLQVTNMYVTEKSKRNVFISIQIIFSLLFTCYDTLQRSIVHSESDLLCSSSTTWVYMSPDGSVQGDQNDVMTANNCLIFSLTVLLSSVVLIWCGLAVFVELWLRVVQGMKDVKFYRRFYFWGGLVISLGNFLLLVLYGHPLMAQPASWGTCSWGVNDLMLSYYLSTLPKTIYFCAALLLAAHVLYVCVKVSTQIGTADAKPLTKLWKSYRILFLFVIMFFVVYVPALLWVGNYMALVEIPRSVDSYLTWSICVFSFFNNERDDTYMSTCGAFPSFVIPSGEIMFMMFLPILENIILCVITMNTDATAFWLSLYEVCARKRDTVLMAANRRSSSVSSVNVKDINEAASSLQSGSTASLVSHKRGLLYSMTRTIMRVVTGDNSRWLSHKRNSVCPSANYVVNEPLGDCELEARPKGGAGVGDVEKGFTGLCADEERTDIIRSPADDGDRNLSGRLVGPSSSSSSSPSTAQPCPPDGTMGPTSLSGHISREEGGSLAKTQTMDEEVLSVDGRVHLPPLKVGVLKLPHIDEEMMLDIEVL